MKSYNRQIAEDLAALRNRLGLTQGGFAQLFNETEPLDLQTSRVDVCRYESGATTPPTNKYIKFLTLKPR